MRQKFFQTGILSFLLLLLFSCGGGKSSDKNIDVASANGENKFVYFADAKTFLSNWSKENILVEHILSDAKTLHPTNGNDAIRQFVFQYLHIPLIATDQMNMSIRPALVKAMPEVSADELQYTYELRDEPTFDDGSQLTVDDVIFSLKVLKCPLVDCPNAKSYVENLKTIEIDKTNPRKFTMFMKKKYIQNIAFLTDYGIIEQKFYDPKKVLANYSFEQLDAKDFKTTASSDIQAWVKNYNDEAVYGGGIESNISGLGAYQLEKWDKGSSMILVRKKNSWLTKLTTPSAYETAFPDKIIFRVIKDDAAIMLAFKNQEIDVSAYISTKMLEQQLVTDSSFLNNYNYRYIDGYGYNYLCLNTRPDQSNRKPLFTDKNVRRAIALLVPVDQLVKEMLLGHGTRITTIVPTLKPEHDTSLAPLPLDIAQAKKLLDDAGWKDTDGDNIRDKMINGVKVKFEFEFAYPSAPAATVQIVKTIKDEMYKAGILVDLKSMEGTALMGLMKTHNFDMTISGFGGSSLPDDFTQLWATQSWSNSGSNYCGFGNAESDALIAQIAETIDFEKRVPLIHKLEKMVYDDQPVIFLYYPNRKVISHKRFGNTIYTFDKPGVLLNNFKLLSSELKTTKQ